MSLGKFKTSVLRQTHRSISKDTGLDYANGDITDDYNTVTATSSGPAAEAIRKSSGEPKVESLKHFHRPLNRLNVSILKTFRRKLPWNSSRDCSGDHGGGVSANAGVDVSSSPASSKKGKTAKASRAICPMPSPIRALRRLSASKDNREPATVASVLASAESVGNIMTSSAALIDNAMPLRTVIVRRQSAGFMPSETTRASPLCSNPGVPSSPCQAVEDSRVTGIVRTSGDLREMPVDSDYILAQYDIALPKVRSLTVELFRLSKYGWYWGPISRGEAEDKLVDQTDGAFLVRDSSDDRYLLSLSFRSFGKTLHTRIEHCNGMFSFYAQPESEGHKSIVELIEHSMNYSQSGIFCYSRARTPGAPSYPVRLTKPVSRFTQVRTLQYLCRFVIRQYTRVDLIQELPLPTRIRGYIEEGHY